MKSVTYTCATTVSVTVDLRARRISKVTVDDENVDWTSVIEAFGADEIGQVTTLGIDAPEVATALRCAERESFPAWTFG